MVWINGLVDEWIDGVHFHWSNYPPIHLSIHPMNDLRFAFRQLLKNPGFTVVAVVTLALGIGANSTIFSLTNALFFRALSGVKDLDQLVSLDSAWEGRIRTLNVSYADFLDFRTLTNVFVDMAAAGRASEGVFADIRDHPQPVQVDLVTGNYFDVLGVQAILGRTLFSRESQERDAHPVAVLRYGFWQRQLDSAADAVGRTIKLNGHFYTVVGVVPEPFQGDSLNNPPDLWIPLGMVDQVQPRFQRERLDLLNTRGIDWLRLRAKLLPGVSIEQAKAAVMVRERQIQTEARMNSGRIVTVTPLDQSVHRAMEDLASFARFLQVLTGFLLLICCVNLASLLLVRGVLRRQEVAVRLALGAGKVQLIRQLLTESTLLALVGGAAGLLVTLWLANVLTHWLADAQMSEWFLGINLGLNFGFKAGGELGPDLRVVGFTFGVSVLTGVAFGLLPGLRGTKIDLNSLLKNETPTPLAGIRRFSIQNLLVIGQLGVSLMLLIVTGFFVKTTRGGLATDLGFEHQRVLAVALHLEEQGYSEIRARLFYQEAFERLRSLPGVESVALARHRPLGPTSDFTVCDLGDDPAQPGHIIKPFGGDYNVVDAEYFQTMGIPLVRGRKFGRRDEGGPLVVIINETLAERLWPDQNPIGNRMRVDKMLGPPWQKRFPAPGGGTWAEVIGVASDSKYRSFAEKKVNHLYFFWRQRPETSMHFFVRTRGNPKDLLPAVRDNLLRINPDLPLSELKTMTQHLGARFSLFRKFSDLTTVVGMFGLLLSAIGLYGVTSYSMSQRTKEFGIRVALGARGVDILMQVLKHGLFVAAIGLGSGTFCALVVARILNAFVHGIRFLDASAYITVLLLMAFVALIACYLPARRAAKLDPMKALRCE